MLELESMAGAFEGDIIVIVEGDTKRVGRLYGTVYDVAEHLDVLLGPYDEESWGRMSATFVAGEVIATMADCSDMDSLVIADGIRNAR